jgi:hypothetical protein
MTRQHQDLQDTESLRDTFLKLWNQGYRWISKEELEKEMLLFRKLSKGRFEAFTFEGMQGLFSVDGQKLSSSELDAILNWIRFSRSATKEKE